jgi:hypothetical protein
MKEWKEMLLVTMMSFMFWQMMYPQFALAEDTYLCLDQKEKDPEEDFFLILDAKEGDLLFKSRLWEWIQNRQHE